MHFKLDKNVPVDAAKLLKDAGHDASTVRDEDLSGAQDPVLVAKCLEEGLALITLDLDFADIRTYPPDEYKGLLVLRLGRQDTGSVLAALRRSLPLLNREELTGHLWIVEDERVRIRGADELA
jgi:predicted nuclease of predicted toxin-antitoxin system